MQAQKEFIAKIVLIHLFFAIAGWFTPANAYQYTGSNILINTDSKNETNLSEKNEIKGALRGIIIDEETGEALLGATIIIEETSQGRSTDINGEFLLENIEPGIYSLRVQYLSYLTKVIEDVEIREDATTRLEITLTPKTEEMDAIIISARALRNTEASLLARRQKSSSISDAISAEKMSRSGSSNAADAMEKVTGATVVDNKYVYVRGLGGRYMNTRLNGSGMPSSDPDKNAVAFDLFPASLLDNITTTKSSSADMPGDFTGGSVNITTKSFPDQLEGSVSFSSGYNSLLGVNADYLLYDGGKLGFFGQTSKQHRIPDVLVSQDVNIPSLGAAYTDADAASALDSYSKMFNSVMTPKRVSTPYDAGFSISAGNQISLFGRPFGLVGSFSQSRSSGGYGNGQSSRYQLTGNAATTEKLSSHFVLNDQKGSEKVLWGGLVNLSFKPAPEHELGTNFMFNKNIETGARFLSGAFPRDLPDDAIYQTSVLDYTERTLNAYQFHGKHAVSAASILRFDWDISMAYSEQDQPDLRFFSNDLLTRTQRNGDVDSVYAISPSIYPVPTRFYRNLQEDSFESNASLSLPLQSWTGVPSKVKTGVSYSTKERDFTDREFQFRQDGISFNGDHGTFFREENLGIDPDRSTGSFFRFGNYLIDNTQRRNNYDGSQSVFAAFLQAEGSVFNSIRASGGLRYEVTDIFVQSADSSIAPGKINERDVLPSVNVTYEVTDRMNLRFAYGKTLARPTSREMAPFSSYDFVNANIVVGNPALQRSIVHNYDLRWEWFVQPGDLLAISLFHKNFTNPIEKVFNPIAAASNPEIQFRNVDHAILYGIELEARRNLGDITTYLDGFDAGFNLTLVTSEVAIADDELALIRALNNDAKSTRELQGQSPYIINMDLTYQNAATGTRLSSYYNLFGKRMSEVSVGGTPNVYEYSRHQLNIIAEQTVINNMSVKLSVSNLLNSEYKKGHEFKGVHYYTTRYPLGRSFSASVNYHF